MSGSVEVAAVSTVGFVSGAVAGAAASYLGSYRVTVGALAGGASVASAVLFYFYGPDIPGPKSTSEAVISLVSVAALGAAVHKLQPNPTLQKTAAIATATIGVGVALFFGSLYIISTIFPDEDNQS